MINVWDYAETLPKIKLIDKFGGITTGEVICVLDAEENETAEDSITIEREDIGPKTFFQSEIESIEVIR